MLNEILVNFYARDVRKLIEEVNVFRTEEHMKDDYPMMFDGAQQSKGYVLVQLLAHLNYHLGQVKYLRRTLE